MEYKNKLLQASFRGISFGVQDIETTLGRRTVLHEYPLRDDPYSEDLGRKAREFSINAFVINKNDYAASKALASVLEDFDTPGTLVHPTLGAIQVVPTSCRHRYSNQEGAIEYFNVSFTETLGNNFPNVVIDTQSFARRSVNQFLTDSTSYFSSKFGVSGYSDFIANAAIDKLEQFSTKFRGLVNFGSARNGNPTNYSKLIARLNDFESNIPDLVFTPDELANEVNNLNKDLNASFTDDLELAMLIQRRLWEYGDDFLVIIGTTNLRDVERQNQQQLILLVRNSVLAEMVRNASLMNFASSEDAIATRDDIDTRGWEQLEELANDFDDAIYTSLLTTLNSMIQDIKQRSINAGSIRSFLITDPMPALKLAYQYLNDASRDDEIIDRNNIINPLYVPANTQIKVVV